MQTGDSKSIWITSNFLLKWKTCKPYVLSDIWTLSYNTMLISIWNNETKMTKQKTNQNWISFKLIQFSLSSFEMQSTRFRLYAFCPACRDCGLINFSERIFNCVSLSPYFKNDYHERHNQKLPNRTPVSGNIMKLHWVPRWLHWGTYILGDCSKCTRSLFKNEFWIRFPCRNKFKT